MDAAQSSGYTELLVQATHYGDTKEFLILEKPSWAVLSSNIRSAFCIDRSIAITYHDDDGDAITLDSDVELQELVAMLRAGGQATLKVVVQTLGDVALYPEVPTVQEMEMELSPHSPSLIQPAPNVSNSDDWNMIPHLPVDAAISAVAQSESSSSGTHSTPENPFIAPLEVHAPPSESSSTKGKEKVVDVDVDMVEVEGEPATASSNEAIVQDIMQMTADLQKAMDQFAESQNATAPPVLVSEAGGLPAPQPASTTPLSAPPPPPVPVPAPPQTLPPDLSQSFNRVIGELLEAVQLLAASNSSEGGDEWARQERDRLKADLMRDVGVLVEQLRATLTRSATLLASQMQIQVARVVAEIQARAAVYQAAAAAQQSQRAPGARAENSDSDSSSDSSDSSSESDDDERPTVGDQFDDWAYTGMTKEQIKAARKEWKRAAKTWKKEAKRGARTAEKEGHKAEKEARKGEKGARKEARRAHEATRRAEKEARREARRRVMMQTRALALATASFAGDSLRHAANQLSTSLHSKNPEGPAAAGAPPTLPPNPTPAQTAEFAKYITVAVAEQVRRGVETAAAYASTAYGSGAGATGHGLFAAGAPPPPPAPAVPAAPPATAAPAAPSSSPAPAAPASPPTLAPAAPAAPAAPPAPAVPAVPAPVAPAPHAVPAPVPHFRPWTAVPLAPSAPVVPPSVIGAPPAPARDYGYEARRLREMGFPAGPNGEPLESMLARYDGNVDNVLAEILGA